MSKEGILLEINNYRRFVKTAKATITELIEFGEDEDVINAERKDLKDLEGYLENLMKEYEEKYGKFDEEDLKGALKSINEKTFGKKTK